MRGTFRLVLAALALSAVTAFLSCKPGPSAWNGFVYPPTYAVPLDDSAKEVSRLNAMLMGSEIVSGLNRIRDATAQSRMVRPFLEGPKDWSRVPLPADLSRSIGGAAMYVLRGDGNIRELVCVKGNVLYSLPEDLNQLLRVCGMRFTNADMHKWVPVVIFVCLACDQIGVQTSGMDPGSSELEWTLDSIVEGQAPLVPSLTAGKLVADMARPSGDGRSPRPVLKGSVSRVRVDVQAGSTQHTVTIRTAYGGWRSGGPYPVEFVDRVEGRWILRVDLPRSTPARPDRDHPKFDRRRYLGLFGVRIVR